MDTNPERTNGGNNGNNKDRIERIESNLERLVTAMLGLAEHAGRTDARIEALAISQAALAESQAALTEAQRNTEERLNALISVVDDLVRRTPPPPQAS